MSEHRNPTKRDRISLAPYNFVPTAAKVLAVTPGIEQQGSRILPWQQQDRYLAGTHSGILELTIRAESPMYVRCAPQVAQAEDENTRTNRHRQDFFHHGDPEHPVIPGSSLRGMTRALVEILAFGKLQFFSPRRLFYRAVADSSSLRRTYAGHLQQGVKGGYLQRDGESWYIQPAKTHGGDSFVRVDYSAAAAIGIKPRQAEDPYGPDDVVEVDIRLPGPRQGRGVTRLADVEEGGVLRAQGPVRPGFVRAVLVRSGHLGKKHRHCAVFEKSSRAPRVEIDPETWTLYQRDSGAHRSLPTRQLAEGAPLFYLEDAEGLVFFGPTLMFRLPYPHSIAEMVPCDGRDELDLAETIFGTVEGETPFKGRVFFEDAPWNGEGGEPFLDQREEGLRSPKLLAEPKPTAFQHYLVQRQPDRLQELMHWGSSPRDTQIRGFKRYWHRPQADEGEMFEATLRTADQMATIIRPVRPGTVFGGRVRFDNLTDLELGALLTALDLPPDLRHHVGMGKPRGMGSARIEVQLRLIDRTARYRRLVDRDGRCQTGLEPQQQVGAIRSRCLAVLRKALLDHHARTATMREAAREIWQIPRLADLALMLDRRGGEERTTRYRKPGEPEGTVPAWWRKRPVLPTPQGVVPRLSPPGIGDRGIWVTLEETTKKGGLKFRHRESGAIGILHPNSPRPPAAQPGDEVELTVQADGQVYALTYRQQPGREGKSE